MSSKKRIPKLIYGEDNGECSLWDITLGEYNHYNERIRKAYDAGKDEKGSELEKELASHLIVWNGSDYGYVPDFAVYLAEFYNIDVDSN